MEHRRPLIAANWKMYPLPDGWDATDSPYRPQTNTDVLIFAPHLYLQQCTKAGLRVGAQCARPEAAGAFTGDISMQMLKRDGVEAVLCGHSERRRYHGETDAFVAAEAAAALEAGLVPVVCIGETAQERETGSSQKIISTQLTAIIPLIEKHDLVIAYEPVWAISGGDPTKPAASAKDAQEMHAFIRSLLPSTAKEKTRILYGGSMKASNAKELLAQPDIDGGLVGGASLKPEEFRMIVEAALG